MLLTNFFTSVKFKMQKTSFFTLILMLIRIDNHYMFVVDLFGKGSDQKVVNRFKYLSSSSDDIRFLHDIEKKYVNYLHAKNYSNMLMENYPNIGNMENIVYVNHPINCYELLKRTTKFLPKLLKIVPDQDLTRILPFLPESYQTSLFGLADIQEYYDLDPLLMSNGTIQSNSHFFLSKSKLNVEDMMSIADAAKEQNYLDGHVKWLNAALIKAKKDRKNLKFIKSLKSKLKHAKYQHDEIFLTKAYLPTNVDDTLGPKVKDRPYLLGEETIDSDFMEKKIKYNIAINKNLFPNELKPDMKYYWEGIFFLRNRTQELCKGTYFRDPFLDKHLKCKWLNHENSFLKLGPFKFEPKHVNPQIAEIHDLISEKQAKEFINKAKGRLKPTPYSVKGKQKEFSKLRTSKVMYINERHDSDALGVSKIIEYVTRMKLSHERFASENFQVMNYGIGGKIAPHLDSLQHSSQYGSEQLQYGGPRFTTFMLYLTSVEAGGHTIFPQAGISVKPQVGSALFWFNVGPRNNYDSRIVHLGCPVLYGNKWIANKWIKWLPNYESFPCDNDKNHFNIE